MWWRKKPEPWRAALQTGDVTYPGGSAVRVLGGRAWYITKGKAFLIPSERVLESWNFNTVALTRQENINKFKVAGKLGFRDGTLIRDIGDNKVYLIADNKRRHITDPDVFVKYGLNRDKIVEVSSDEAALHEDGEVLK